MKTILGIYNSPAPHWVGDGFPVRSLFSYHEQASQVSPFLLLDYAGPAEFAPGERPRGVGQHPHRGFETVTIVYQGELEHRDSTGSGGRIGPGDVQWMTAAAGILHQEFHSEAFTRSGGTLEMVQLWVNLPAKHKMAAPHYQTLLAAAIPVADLPENAGTLRVIAGDYAGHSGPAHTYTPMNVWDLRLKPGSHAALDLPEGHTALIVVLHGTVHVNGKASAHDAQLVLLDRKGHELTLDTDNEASVLLLSGEPIDEPVAGHGPFVMNTPSEIEQAFADYQSGRFGQMA